MAERRELSFNHIDEVMADVDQLLDGHTTTKNWSLGQICNHLALATRYSIEGFPMKAPWLVRATIGKSMLKKNLKSGKMAEDIKVPDSFIPKPGLDARAEAEALRAAIRHYKQHTGPMAMHPFFGNLARDQWDRLHCIHGAHHLSFARPVNHA